MFISNIRHNNNNNHTNKKYTTLAQMLLSWLNLNGH